MNQQRRKIFKNWRAKVSLSGFLGLLICTSVTVKAHEFCVQSFNAYGPVYASNLSLRTSLLVDYLKQEGSCELIQFQEVWREEHQKELSLLMGQSFPRSKGVLFDHIRRDQKITGLTSWSNEPVLKTWTEIYKINKGGAFDWFRRELGVHKGWGALLVEIDHKPLLVINTHLHHQSQAARLAQILDLAKFIQKLNSYHWPIVLTGDFNAEPGSLEWHLITSIMGFRDAYWEGQGYLPGDCTYCSDNSFSWSWSDRVIDYVFFKASEKYELEVKSANVGFQSYQGVNLSDHYGLRAEFFLSEKTPYSKVNYVIDKNLNKKHVVENILDVLRSESDRDYLPFVHQLERYLEGADIFAMVF